MTRKSFLTSLLAWIPAVLLGQSQIAKENIIVADITEREGTSLGVPDGQLTSFTLTYSPVGNASVRVFLNGLHQRQAVGGDYTVAGKVITFRVAPPAGSTLDVDYRGYFG